VAPARRPTTARETRHERLAARLRATSRLDFNQVLRKRPDARWGSLVTAAFQREVMYRRCLPPNTTERKDEAVAAAGLVKQQIIQRKLQRLLQDTTDLGRPMRL